MMISNREQLLLLFRCLGCGMWLGLFWEILSAFRRTVHYRIGRFTLDMLGVPISGLFLFVFALAINAGEMRPVMLIAVAVGMVVIHTTIGRFIPRLKRWCKRVFAPFYMLWRACLQRGGLFFEKSRKKVVFFYKKGLQFCRIRVYNRNN